MIRAPDGLSVIYAAPIASALRATMPRASLQFVPEAYGDRGSLRDGSIDLDIGSVLQHDTEAVVIELDRFDQVGAVADGHALARGRPSAERYAREAHVAVMQRPREASAVDDALSRIGLKRRIVLVVPNSYAAIIAAARAGLVATAAERVAAAMAPSLGMKVFALPFEMPQERQRMAWHPRDTEDPAHRCLRETVQRVLAARMPAAPPLEGLPDVRGRSNRR